MDADFFKHEGHKGNEGKTHEVNPFVPTSWPLCLKVFLCVH